MALAALAVAGVGWWVWAADTPERLLARAEAATRAGDWPAALRGWRAVNAGALARARTHLAEARAALALGRAADAERALARATSADASEAEPWRVWLELLRVEDRTTDALNVGWAAYAAVPPAERRGVLRELTLALLADLPDDAARDALGRWTASPGLDPDARAALLQRFNTMPRAGDPPRAARVAELTELLVARPAHPGLREALVTALLDDGQTEAAARALDAWPEGARDARYWRLRGRWELDHGRDPSAAAAAFARALAELPHDWKTRVRLARALRAQGRADAAKAEADAVGRLREALDPIALGPRLAADLPRPNHPDPAPAALLDLADLCARAGLTRLAEAWRREAGAPPVKVGEKL